MQSLGKPAPPEMETTADSIAASARRASGAGASDSGGGGLGAGAVAAIVVVALVVAFVALAAAVAVLLMRRRHSKAQVKPHDRPGRSGSDISPRRLRASAVRFLLSCTMRLWSITSLSCT